eukprot:867817_1
MKMKQKLLLVAVIVAASSDFVLGRAIKNFCNGAIDSTNGVLTVVRSIDGKAILTCKPGHELVSPAGESVTSTEVATCLSVNGGGIWSTQTATCKDKCSPSCGEHGSCSLDQSNIFQLSANG